MNILESLEFVLDSFILESLLLEEGEYFPGSIRDEAFRLIDAGEWNALQDLVYQHHKESGMGEAEARRRAFRAVTTSKKILKRRRAQEVKRGVGVARGVLPGRLIDARMDKMMRTDNWEGVKERIIDYYTGLGYDYDRAESNADRYVSMLRRRYAASATTR